MSSKDKLENLARSGGMYPATGESRRWRHGAVYSPELFRS